MVTEDFVVSGTCSEQMYGMCESLWEPDMVSVVEEFRDTPPLFHCVSSNVKGKKTVSSKYVEDSAVQLVLNRRH